MHRKGDPRRDVRLTLGVRVSTASGPASNLAGLHSGEPSPAATTGQRPHLDGLTDRVTDAGRPFDRRVDVRGLDQVEATQVLLGLGEWSVGALGPTRSAANHLRLGWLTETRGEDEG